MNKKKKSRRKVMRKRKFSVLLASLLLVFAVGVCGTAAYLITNTEPVTNTFIPAEMKPEINEDIKSDPGVKEKVTITNGGNVDAYVRANVIVTWKQGENVYGQLPVKEEDYEMTIPADSDWVLGPDGFYYYTKPIEAGGETGQLLTDGKLKDGASVPDGCELSIEIFAQTIQSEPEDAVLEAWSSGVSSVDENHVLTIKE